MRDIQPIVETLKCTMLQKLGDEVDLIFQYGSQIKGTTHEFSDVDLSYVPVHHSTWENITVLVDGTLFDFYPMHWSHLERMAEFRDISSSVLLQNRVLFARNEEALRRFDALGEQLQTLQGPEAKPRMVRRAFEIFQSTGYEFYLLGLQADVHDQAGCIKEAHSILRTVLHCLAVCNQACIDTRKMDQVLALPRLPVGFADSADRMISALEPDELLFATRALLQTTREFLLAEQRQFLCSETDYRAVFDSGYPELKRDIQAVMLACEQRDLFSLKGSLLSLLHEISRGIARVTTGVSYLGFNGMSEYEQDLARLGFPALLPYLRARDYDGLYRQCLAFDMRLREFLIERNVGLNSFTTLDDLREHLALLT
jgi:predicted nucleotidyltransferase